MKITSQQIKAAEFKGHLYGVRFDGMQEMTKGRSPMYTWTDLVTGNTFLTKTIKELPNKVIALRKKYSNPPLKRIVSKAVKLSRKFYGFDPRKIKSIDVHWPKSLTCLGLCSQVSYVSDKTDGKMREYYHRFDGKVTLFAGVPSQKNGENLLIIKGKFKIQPEGITG